MKIPLSCIQCVREKKEQAYFYADILINNESVYSVKCGNGHDLKMNYLNVHFSLLFDNAIAAIVDGYLIEAVSSFALSYERFREFFLKTALLGNKLDPKRYDAAWKEVSKQSERQLGAFIFTHLTVFGEMPALLSNSKNQFRNDVIHKGQFPTVAQCISYGNQILGIIRSVMAKLKTIEDYDRQMVSLVNEKIVTEPGVVDVTFVPYFNFAINRSFNETDEKQVTDFIEDYRKL